MEAVKYLSAQEISALWGITKRRVQDLCVSNRIDGAVRIGNMWAIPSNASKPEDARVHKRAEIVIPAGSVIRKARKNLRAIVNAAMEELHTKGMSPVNALQTLIVSFSAKLLETFLENSAECLAVCEDFFGYKTLWPLSDSVNRRIEDFIRGNKTCLDDSLSWVYQFSTKESEVFKFKDTQFFTEKYMINTLVDALQLDLNAIVIDPACGGGNFLLYAFEILVSQVNDSNQIRKVNAVLDKLYGYEIDQILAYVASFNLKLKALAYISENEVVSFETFKACHPRVFYPAQESISGFLDIEWNDQIVVDCDNGKRLQLVDAFDGANTVITNPPFRTIKGMPAEQKRYLQEHYPLAKCDLCNAFIERVMTVLPTNGTAAMVTQNSWMYLDSFTQLRKMLLNECEFNNIWELGSNAFYDLSGEKANIALVTFTKNQPNKEHEISLSLLRNQSIEQIERDLEKKQVPVITLRQSNVLNNPASRFDMVSTEHLKSLRMSCDQYKDYAVPMQGTSTGDAKSLIDYYWRHIGDEDWVLVSKGGGYSRFEGLNSYCVKWGKDGEYIKKTKGSAIRNASFFNQTQLVFSDTGTAGLNVRRLMPGQIFVASGPGIRITKGKPLSHLAFLNSRFAAFYVRLLSPKLTIAAGYIGQIPVTERILNSKILERCAEQCLQAKARRLSKRPNNIEFSYVKHRVDKSISEMARMWFLEDIDDEWTQLLSEQRIEDEITRELRITDEDQKAISDYVGERLILSLDHEQDMGSIGNDDFAGVLGVDCFPKRTKASKKSLGVDGFIEFVSQTREVSCEKAKAVLLESYPHFSEKYTDLYVHALAMSALDYRKTGERVASIDNVLSDMGIKEKQDVDFAVQWIETRFNDIHRSIFETYPMFEYIPSSHSIIKIEA